MICDIEMPKENGLSLIQWIQDMYPEIINIILTGYPDFNYARSAIFPWGLPVFTETDCI